MTCLMKNLTKLLLTTLFVPQSQYREKHKQQPDKKAICECVSTHVAVNTDEYEASSITESLIYQRI